MPVFRVNLSEPIAELPSAHFAIVDTPHETVDEILADLQRGPLCMDQLETRRHVEPRTFEIVARRRILIALVGVASIQQTVHRYVEYDDVAAPPPLAPARLPIRPVNDEEVNSNWTDAERRHHSKK